MDFGTVNRARDELESTLDELGRRPFDLTRRVPIRATLIRVAPDEHVLALVMYHIASDGWSMRPLMRDLAVTYTARLAHHAPQWTELRCSTRATRCGNENC